MDELEKAVHYLCQYRGEIPVAKIFLAAHKLRKQAQFAGKTAIWLRGEILEKMENLSGQ